VPKTLSDPEVECLKLKKEINENHRLAQKAAGDAVERAVLTGELLAQWKELLPHGKFEAFVETHFDGSARTARLYMQAAKELRSLSKRQSSAVLATEDSMAGLLSRLKKDEPASKHLPKASPGSNPAVAPEVYPEAYDESDSISAKGKPGGDQRPSSTPTPASPGPASGEAADSSAPVDYGRCPNCAGTKWDDDDLGVSCSKCGHPHGESLGDSDETGEASKKERAKIMRLKFIKTVEACQRAVDDMNDLVKRPVEHKQGEELTKQLLRIAKGWPA
jgi:hypothetical protein